MNKSTEKPTEKLISAQTNSLQRSPYKMPSSTVDIKAPASNGIPEPMVKKTGDGREMCESVGVFLCIIIYRTDHRRYYAPLPGVDQNLKWFVSCI
jgi:hypothetical protein